MPPSHQPPLDKQVERNIKSLDGARCRTGGAIAFGVRRFGFGCVAGIAGAGGRRQGDADRHARAAFALIRKRATEWRVDPQRIGMVGFSAGAMLTLATTTNGEDAKPAFIGNIYGPLAATPVPADAPPLFIALAADDPFFANAGYGLIDSWKAAKRPVEFHLYEQGGHGFGMYPKTTTSTGWFEAFVSWLRMHGMTK